jgi:hypothetical protein
MNGTHSSILVPEVPGYAELQRKMHDALRAQHPEWIEGDGTSCKCDSYESRLAELLALSLPIESAREAAAPNMPRQYGNGRKIVFHDKPSPVG